MKISILFLLSAMLLAQAMPMTLEDCAVSTECQASCCPPGQCACCAVQNDTKPSSPVTPATNDTPVPKAIPFATSMLTRRDSEVADSAHTMWRLLIEHFSEGDVPLNVLHCTYLI